VQFVKEKPADMLAGFRQISLPDQDAPHSSFIDQK
jgi:hypothetical protein